MKFDLIKTKKKKTKWFSIFEMILLLYQQRAMNIVYHDYLQNKI